VYEIVSAVRAHVKRKPLIVKLSPNVADIALNARRAEEAGADAVSLINTIGGMAVDWMSRRPVLGNVCGGLSGAAVKPVALKMVWQCYNAVKIPIIGMGGIMSAQDALEFMVCGASAVMVGTGNIVNPNICKNIVIDLTKITEACNINNIGDIVGSLCTEEA
jgi:dihydroorotate dehydrogenase (NAD+) catalytic subunit